MNRFKNQILLAAGFAVLAGVISGITAAPAIAQAIKAALIKNVDEPGRHPYSVRSACVTPLNNCAAPFDAIPAGSRFVVEYVTVVVVPSNGPNGVADVILQNSGGTVKSYLDAAPHADTGLGSSIFSSSHSVRAFYEPGEIPMVLFAVNTGGIAGARAVLTGYLIDLTI